MSAKWKIFPRLCFANWKIIFSPPKKHRCSHWFSFIENYNSVPKIGFYVIYFVFHPNKTQWSRAYSNSGSQKYLSSKMWTPWKNITFLFFKRAEWRISKKYAKKIHSVAVLCEIKKSLKNVEKKKMRNKKKIIVSQDLKLHNFTTIFLYYQKNQKTALLHEIFQKKSMQKKVSFCVCFNPIFLLPFVSSRQIFVLCLRNLLSFVPKSHSKRSQLTTT